MSSPTKHKPPTTNTSYNNVLSALLPPAKPHIFVSPPSSPHPLLIPQSSRSAIPTISSLSLHPTLESVLHLLNLDLPSAHFLLRHSEAEPAWESMYLHGILHRIETDVDNARCWYRDVEGSEVFGTVWGSGDGGEEGKGDMRGWKEFLDRVERWRDSVRARNGSKRSGKRNGTGVVDVVGDIDWEKEEAELREISFGELFKVLEFCEKKFGVGEIQDATKQYITKGKTSDIAAAMITGGEGWREF